MAALPPYLIDVATALDSQGRVNVIGMVVDTMTVFQSKNSSYLITFTIKDCDFGTNAWQGLKVKYFHRKMDSLPDVKEGHVIVLRNLRIQLFNNRKMGVAGDRETVLWAIFPRDPGSLPICGPTPFDPTPLEEKYARALLNRAENEGYDPEQQQQQRQQHQHQQQPSPLPRPFINRDYPDKTLAATTGRAYTFPFTLIKDIKPRTMVELVAQIVNVYGNDGNRYMIYVTDYTSNPALLGQGEGDSCPRLGDEYGHLDGFNTKRASTMGEMTLPVTLWERQASYAREHFQVGDIVILKRAHVKKSHVRGNLEASVHGDKKWPDKIHVDTVIPEDDTRARELLKRKREYLKQERADGKSRDEQNETSKNKRRKTERARKKQQEAKLEEGQKPLASTAIRIRHQLNENITSWQPDVRCLPLEDILSNESHNNVSPEKIEYRLPFQNICYRSLVRVVDFFPPNLEDFSVPIDRECAALSDSESDLDDLHNCDITINSSSRNIVWEWRFCLLVESASPSSLGQTKERMKLFVSGPDAEHLLKLDATNLRQSSKALARLREKLFILWGDLEERKMTSSKMKHNNGDNAGGMNSVETTASLLPFICCIKEYGVKCSHGYNGADTQAQNSDNNADQIAISKEIGCSRPDCFGWERRFAMFGTAIN
ncbi:hypothetical protein MPDQ_005779 [Monascus purpureus]|uniref:Protection of telomeres protein 1 n=1 Tax=Monascus purpureus TaxID=5098 RepID=A0A507QVQ7_MONPU|nr:hypothetical protein MPDQ_005779 [Monascus purpureus]BDD55208.1 hypothetical protein MAP00_000754 [Monascus purpureus]